MHMADALLSPPVGGAFWVISGGMAAYSAARLKREKTEQIVPLMGVLGAFVFGAQMINFSIPGTGSSGHIGGGMLLAMLLGPPAAFITMASVLIVQCLFFADGGLLALGANVFNMGVFSCFVGYVVYRAVAGGNPSPARLSAGAIVGTVVALELGAMSVVLQTLLSGRSDVPFGRFAALMMGIHLPIALVEGMMTAAVVSFVFRLRPRIVGESLGIRVGSEPPAQAQAAAPRVGAGTLVVALGGLAVLAAGFLSWFASAKPDGLEFSLAKVRAAETVPAEGLKKTLARVQDKISIFPDYGFARREKADAAERTEPAQGWLASPEAGASVSGLVGSGLVVLLVSGVSGLLALFRPRKRPAAPTPSCKG
jgi:cobalt/nickel transport system permease protein